MSAEVVIHGIGLAPALPGQGKIQSALAALRRWMGASTLLIRPDPNQKEPPLYRPSLRACVLAAALLASSGTLALAKPSFETGPYYGSVAAKAKPVVQFTATSKRVKKLEIDSLQVTCADKARGALNLPGTPATRNFKLKRGRFAMTVKASGDDAAYAGTRVTGRLKGRKATGTVRIVYRKPSETDPAGIKCDTGKRKWTAQLDEIVVELP